MFQLSVPRPQACVAYLLGRGSGSRDSTAQPSPTSGEASPSPTGSQGSSEAVSLVVQVCNDFPISLDSDYREVRSDPADADPAIVAISAGSIKQAGDSLSQAEQAQALDQSWSPFYRSIRSLVDKAQSTPPQAVISTDVEYMSEMRGLYRELAAQCASEGVTRYVRKY